MSDEDAGGFFGRPGAWPSVVALVAVVLGLTQFGGASHKDASSPPSSTAARANAPASGDARPVLLSPTPFIRPLELIVRQTLPSAMFVASITGDPTLNERIRGELVKSHPSCATPAMLDT